MQTPGVIWNLEKKTQRGLNLLSGKNGLTKSVGDIAIGVIKTAIKND